MRLARPGAPVLPKAVSAAPGTLSSHTRVGVARVNCGYCVGGRPAGHRDREVAVGRRWRVVRPSGSERLGTVDGGDNEVSNPNRGAYRDPEKNHRPVYARLGDRVARIRVRTLGLIGGLAVLVIGLVIALAFLRPDARDDAAPAPAAAPSAPISVMPAARWPAMPSVLTT